ncbi:hypothetical protein Tco_0489828 [Tanacetum coccineum]
MWQGPTLMGLGRRKCTRDLNLCALNATTIMMGSVLPGVITERRLAIWPRHYKKDFPKLKNNNRGNQSRNGGATVRAYAVGNAEKNPDANVVTGTFLLNNRYASILFDTSADRSFVSTAFSSLIDIVPTTLDHDYDVKLADGKIIGVNTIIRGCELSTVEMENQMRTIEVMAAPIISILSDSSEESVVPIAPADPIVAPKVGAVSVISPTGVLNLVDYSSSSDFDPSEDSLPRAPSSEFPLAPIVAPPEIFGPFPARRLAWRRVSHRSSDRHSSPDFTSDSSSSSSSSDSSLDISSGSSSYSLSVHSLVQSHSGPSTRVASPRLVDSPVRTTRCSEAYMRWRSAPLSTLYPPTTSESSPDSSFERSLDSSSPSAGPSRKRYRSPTTLVPSSTPISRSIAPALADLPPRKRFRDSYSFDVSGEEHMEMGTTDAETVADLGISEGVGAHTEDGIDLGVEVATSDIREDEEEFKAEVSEGGTMEIAVDPLAAGDIFEPTGGDAPDLEGTLYDMSHYMSEVPLDRITEFETAQRQLEAGQLVASRESCLRRHMALSQEEFRQNMTITRSGMTPEAIEELVNRRVEEALAAYEATHAANALEAESQSQNGSDDNNGNGGNGKPNENDRGARPVA